MDQLKQLLADMQSSITCGLIAPIRVESPAKTILSEEMEKEFCAYLKRCALLNHKKQLLRPDSLRIYGQQATANNGIGMEEAQLEEMFGRCWFCLRHGYASFVPPSWIALFLYKC